MSTVHAPYPGTRAILRAMALLKAFSDARPELSLTELARAVGLNKTTAYRMLTALGMFFVPEVMNMEAALSGSTTEETLAPTEEAPGLATAD